MKIDKPDGYAVSQAALTNGVRLVPITDTVPGP